MAWFGPNESDLKMSDLDIFDGYESDVGLDPEDKKHANAGQVEWFAGEKGQTYRVALVYFHPIDIVAMQVARSKNPGATKADLLAVGRKALEKRAGERGKTVETLEDYEKLYTSKVQFRMAKSFFNENLKGYVESRLGKDGPENDRVWESLGEEKTHFFTAVLVYPTNREGDLAKNVTSGWRVVPWRLATKTYQGMHRVGASLRANKLSVASQDLNLTCTNKEFKQFDVASAGPAEWLNWDKSLQDQVLMQAVRLYGKLQKPFQQISSAELRSKLGMDGGTWADAADDAELASVIDDV